MNTALRTMMCSKNGVRATTVSSTPVAAAARWTARPWAVFDSNERAEELNAGDWQGDREKKSCAREEAHFGQPLQKRREIPSSKGQGEDAK